MKKIAVLIPPVVLLLIILTGCKTSSFNQQKYTNYKVSKENKSVRAVTNREAQASVKPQQTRVEAVKVIEAQPVNSPAPFSASVEKFTALAPPVKTVASTSDGRITASANPSVLVQKTFKTLKLNVKKESNKGPVGWLIDTVFGIILLVLFVALIIFLIVVLL